MPAKIDTIERERVRAALIELGSDPERLRGDEAATRFARISGLLDTFTFTEFDSSVAPLVPAGVNQLPAGIGEGSWRALGQVKAELYLTPDVLFGTGTVFRFDEIEAISWITRKDEPTTPGQGVDWYVNLYSDPDSVDDDAGWYGRRLTFEPMWFRDILAPADRWVYWVTAPGRNQATVYDSNRTNAGWTGTIPTWQDLVAGPIDWGTYPNSGSSDVVDYRAETLKFAVLATGNPWAVGFTGSVDALRLTLVDGRTALVNLTI